MLSDAAKRFLLDAARLEVTQALALPVAASTPAHPDGVDDKRAAFVSLHTRAHELRGCIGTFSFDEPLLSAVRRMARAAAFQDTRFAPVTAAELPGLVFEISALTRPLPIAPAEVVVGRHGLLISRGMFRGVLLPQVAPEWGWDREEFLVHTCRKAGLPDDAWREQGTRVEAFEAEVFSEQA